jgi:RES domain-containing protein
VISCFRLSSGRYPSITGTGAALHGGRWNPAGVEAIYAAATVSLATLETLVHFSVLPRDFVLTEIHIPVRVGIETIQERDLPSDWHTFSPSASTQEIGRKWVVELRSAVLFVPSAITPAERNFVFNPKHPDFRQIKFLPSTPFRFDPRLK